MRHEDLSAQCHHPWRTQPIKFALWPTKRSVSTIPACSATIRSFCGSLSEPFPLPRLKRAGGLGPAFLGCGHAAGTSPPRMSATPTAGVRAKAWRPDVPVPAESALGRSGFAGCFGARVGRFTMRVRRRRQGMRRGASIRGETRCVADGHPVPRQRSLCQKGGTRGKGTPRRTHRRPSYEAVFWCEALRTHDFLGRSRPQPWQWDRLDSM